MPSPDNSFFTQRLTISGIASFASGNEYMAKLLYGENTGGVNDHPQSGWLEFSAIGRKDKSTSVI
jgi:hypothetical protein